MTTTGMTTTGEAVATRPILAARDLTKVYPVRGGQTLAAVAGVSLSLGRGETLGIVGESGCGKSTLARLLVRLEQPTSGRLELDGRDITALSGRDLQIDPPSGAARLPGPVRLAQPAAHRRRRASMRCCGCTAPAHAIRAKRRVGELLDMVDLRAGHADRYPHQLSGGQRQRVGIARALAVEPEVIVLDEPLSSLDVSVQSGIMNLLTGLRDELDVAYVFISHDLGMVRHISDRIAVMYLGTGGRARPMGRRLGSPAPSVHAGVAAGRADRRPRCRGHPPGGHARRGGTRSGEPARRMPVPHPLPAGRGGVPGHAARAARARTATTTPPATSRPGVPDSRVRVTLRSPSVTRPTAASEHGTRDAELGV